MGARGRLDRSNPQRRRANRLRHRQLRRRRGHRRAGRHARRRLDQHAGQQRHHQLLLRLHHKRRRRLRRGSRHHRPAKPQPATQASTPTWNVDVDGTTGNDDPWDFGTSGEYPALKFGGADPDLQRAGGDYDLDNDGLIEIATLAQLDAVRHDLDGNGDPASGGATAYNAAFPIRIKTAATRMGCPSGTCTGYELAAHLDFDTDGDGATYTGSGASAASDSGDAYHNGGNGWQQIAVWPNFYTATFKGNGFIISNLFIKRTGLRATSG